MYKFLPSKLKSNIYKNYMWLKFLYNNCVALLGKRKVSYSDFSEDLILESIFEGLTGSYVDVGAGHPVIGSNSYLFYKKGWDGLNIDLMKINIDLFNIWRPRDKNICCAVSNKSKTGLVYIPNNNMISTEISIQKNYANMIKMHHKNSFVKRKIKIFTFKKIIENFNINLEKFDFLKIDIEGEDYKVLKNINLKKYKPKLICIEKFIEKNTDKIDKYLKSLRYKLVFESPINLFYQKLNNK